MDGWMERNVREIDTERGKGREREGEKRRDKIGIPQGRVSAAAFGSVGKRGWKWLNGEAGKRGWE